MLKTIRSFIGAKRAPKLALVAGAALMALSVAPAGGAPVAGGSTLVASGFHYNYDFNGDGRRDDRIFWFYAIEHADGSVTGQARISITVDDLDGDGEPDVDPFRLKAKWEVRGAARFFENGEDEAIISGIVTSHNYPLNCDEGGYSVGAQMAWAVRDNGNGPGDMITPTLTWDCVPFLGSDYGEDDSLSFAQWAVDQGFGPFLADFLVQVDFGNMYLE